jgi:carbamoyl-phosphate synthase large subunit
VRRRGHRGLGEHPILIDKFLGDATELDVDAISDGETVVIGGIMEHIEEAGVHSGDSACSLPPVNLKKQTDRRDHAADQAPGARPEGPGADERSSTPSRTTGSIFWRSTRGPRARFPFVSKAIGVPLAKLAAKVMAGMTLEELGFTRRSCPATTRQGGGVPVPEVSRHDVLLGPEMLSTGEVMGISDDFGTAYAKSQIAAGNSLPTGGSVLFSVNDRDKPKAVALARRLREMGFKIVATKGTCIELIKNNIPSEFALKMSEGRPHIVDAIINKQIDLIVNTAVGAQAIADSFLIRRNAVDRQVPYVTTMRGAEVIVDAIAALKAMKISVKPIQLYYR